MYGLLPFFYVTLVPCSELSLIPHNCLNYNINLKSCHSDNIIKNLALFIFQDKHHRHKHKKTKKEKHSKSREKHSSASKSMEQLREERLKREAQEKQRAFDLLNGGQGHKEKSKEAPADDRKQKYNSMYNPDLARR